MNQERNEEYTNNGALVFWKLKSFVSFKILPHYKDSTNLMMIMTVTPGDGKSFNFKEGSVAIKLALTEIGSILMLLEGDTDEFKTSHVVEDDKYPVNKGFSFSFKDGGQPDKHKIFISVFDNINAKKVSTFLSLGEARVLKTFLEQSISYLTNLYLL
jgi:hypothetical protein